MVICFAFPGFLVGKLFCPLPSQRNNDDRLTEEKHSFYRDPACLPSAREIWELKTSFCAGRTRRAYFAHTHDERVATLLLHGRE